MNNNYALVAYPLSHTFQKELERVVGDPINFLLLTELRPKPLKEIWKLLRSCQPSTFYLPIEDHNTKILLPILQILAKVARPNHIMIVHPDLSFQKIDLLQVIYSILNFINATCRVNVNYWLSKRTMRKVHQHSNVKDNVPLNTVKKVLYLNTNLWFGVKAGGSVGHIAGVVNALINKGLEVDYAAVDKSALLAPSVNYLPLPSLKGFGFPAVLNYYVFNKKIHNYLRSKKESNWDFIYQRMSIANFTGVSLSRTLNIPLILEYNGSEAWIAKNWGGRPEHEITVKSEEICLKHAHIIVTVSEVLKHELISRGVSPEKIIYYPNCIDPTVFDPHLFSKAEQKKLRAKHHISSEALVLTFVGTFGQWHGVNVLAQVIKKLIEEEEPWLRANNVMFLLVGDGVKMSEVKSILGDAINSSFVCLTGLVPQQEAPAYLAASDILLSPHVANNDGSPFFGSPTKLFEYMAMGKAIVASDLDQIGEVLRQSLPVEQLPEQKPALDEDRLAVLCEPGNVQQLLRAIKFFVENEEWRDVLGINARNEALAKYTWEKHVHAFLSQLIQNPK